MNRTEFRITIHVIIFRARFAFESGWEAEAGPRREKISTARLTWRDSDCVSTGAIPVEHAREPFMDHGANKEMHETTRNRQDFVRGAVR